jgi:predicted nucleic acid-binding protein
LADLFLIDTSFWIPIARRQPRRELVDRFRDLLLARLAATNEIVRLEVLMGSKNLEEKRNSEDQLQALHLLQITAPVWSMSSELGFKLMRAGLPTGIPDLIIAATAIHYEATLLHADSDFETIAQHSELRTESYLQYLDA